MRTAFPSVVWDASLLRGLDDRARAEIEAAGRVRSLRKDEVVFRHGDPADALFVVASGACSLRGVRRGDEGAAVIRRARRGDVFGEEGTVADFSTRQLEARCEEDAVVAEVPLVVLRRAWGRVGDGGLERMLRQLRRAATLDLLRTTSFTRALDDADIDVLLDAAQHRQVPRGELVYAEGDRAEAAFLVADGLLQAQTGDLGKPRVEAYLARGDLFGDEELAAREPRRVSVVASGPTWLVVLPRDVFVIVARRNEAALAGARRLKSGERPPRALANTTTHVFQDLYRMRVARSLLVIDQDSCVRCGHCAWSCADAHADGVSRLVRRGDKLAAPGAVPLLVPNSCQHCKNPACMIDCPTGAIGRDARGEVFIREDLCTGCGSCAKACPWENIAMAPRAAASAAAPAYPLVAVKCDLCSGQKSGPACVNACPTEAIARIDPNVALVPQAAPSASASPAAPVLPPRTPAWPWLSGAALAAMGLAVAGVGRWTSGVVAGALVVLLLAYSAAKRLRLRLSSRKLYIAHMALALLALGVSVAHVGSRVPPNVAGALVVALGIALATGLLGALLNVAVPPRLARLERKSVLPEELAARARELDGQVFRTLSGKSELVKTLYVRALRPYLRAPFGPLWLVATGRSLREEERAVRARLDALMTGAVGKGTAGLDEVVRLVVEHRATRAQRVLTWALRGWLAPHLALAAATLVLLVLHVIGVRR